EGTLELVKTINRALKEGNREEPRLLNVFEKLYPDLEEKLNQLPKEKGQEEPRPMVNMVEEILDIVRGLSRRKEKENVYLLSSDPGGVGKNTLLFHLLNREIKSGTSWDQLISDDRYKSFADSLAEFKSEDETRLVKIKGASEQPATSTDKMEADNVE